MITIICTVVLLVIHRITLNTGVLPFSKGRMLQLDPTHRGPSRGTSTRTTLETAVRAPLVSDPAFPHPPHVSLSCDLVGDSLPLSTNFTPSMNHRPSHLLLASQSPAKPSAATLHLWPRHPLSPPSFVVRIMPTSRPHRSTPI
jgi:hypothetical protein